MSANTPHSDATVDTTDVLPGETLAATVVEYDDEPDECTIYPPRADEDERLTTWVSAKQSSYVSLAEMR